MSTGNLVSKKTDESLKLQDQMQSFKDNMIVQMHALSSREQVSLINQIWDIAYKVVNSFILYHWIQLFKIKEQKITL